jgi:hypothetical protein
LKNLSNLMMKNFKTVKQKKNSEFFQAMKPADGRARRPLHELSLRQGVAACNARRRAAAANDPAVAKPVPCKADAFPAGRPFPGKGAKAPPAPAESSPCDGSKGDPRGAWVLGAACR